MFKVRVVSVDHYISRPLEELYLNKDSNLPKDWKEPVLRIFGATEDGFKSCVHVHGVYPYIYVPYKGGKNPERDALLLGAALDEALKKSFTSKSCRFVHKVILISGIPLYGYHSKHRQFFKIYFYNPFHIRKASELLLSGAILGQKFQPHEAHIPYALQFMMDYNIYGMSFVTFSKVKYRRDPTNSDSLLGVNHEDILSDNVKKITWSYLEVDALAGDILNRVAQKAVSVNPGLQALWEDEQQRRRAQNKDSQLTVDQSQSRPGVDVYPTEVFYKVRLAEKISKISAKDLETRVISGTPTHSYPAEVPENAVILNASAADEDFERPLLRENVSGLSGLVDERILTQISGSLGGAESESEGEMEFDSVLGRNQKSEEEAELEDEEGVDMTQPLESEEEVICGAERNGDEPGSSREDSEEKFWKIMADKIFQLDGAQESSSESEADLTRASAAPASGVSDGPLELSSAWPSNIMSILSEGGGSPTPFATCLTPRTFWFDHTSDWLSPSQESWFWNKNGCAAFSELPGKSQSESLTSNDFLGASKAAVSGESYEDLFDSSTVQGFPASSESLLCNLESTGPPASAVLTPTSENDPNIILESNGKEPPCAPKEKRKPTRVEGKLIKGKHENDQHKLLQVLKNFTGRKVPLEDNCGHLTLKQYIKDCKEIVSVDFKNLCNREMIIIEYKSQNQRSLRNKYLIKPLDKFLESWNSAERKANDQSSPKREKEMKVVKEFDIENEKNYVINVVGKSFSDASTVQSVSNKLTVKSMEILPEGGSAKDRCYNVNENLISRGKIKMKLIKSQRENVEKNLIEGTLNRGRGEQCGRLNLKRAKETDERKEMKKPNERLRESVQNKVKSKNRRNWKNLAEPDTKLINDINSSFEEYFRSIVKRKNVLIKRKQNLIEEINYDDDDDDDNDEEEEEEEELKEEEEEETEDKEVSEDENLPSLPTEENLYASCGADPIKFVTRFLSTFSQMPDVPPLSITIRLGNPRGSAPVRVNLRSSITSSEKEGKHHGKKHRRSEQIENVDGPADGSSSEESTGGDSKRRRRFYGKKKSGREGQYKPLNVIAYCSFGEKGVGGKRKGGAEQVEGAVVKKKSKRTLQDRPGQDDFYISRKKPKLLSFRESTESSSGNTMRSLTEGQEVKISSSRVASGLRSTKMFGSEEESDFICDSENEKSRNVSEARSRRWKRKKKSTKRGRPGQPPQIRIPQADTEDFASSGEEEEEENNRAGDDRGKDLPESKKTLEKVGKKTEGEISSHPLNLASQELKNLFSSDPRHPSPFSDHEKESSAFPHAVEKTLAFSVKSSSVKEELSFQARSFPSSNSSGSALPCGLSKEFGGSSSNSPNGVEGCKKMRPSEKPLSRKEVVESMERHFIVENEENAPFYGDPADVGKNAEIGVERLATKVENRSVTGLKSHKNSLGVVGVEERRSSSLGGRCSERSCWVGNGDARMRPLAKPPSRKSALESWLSRKDSGNVEKESEKCKIKIIKPASPGQEEMTSEEEMELSVTVSSFSGERGTRGPVVTNSPSEMAALNSQTDVGDEAKFRLKKGPLDKIKGMKRFSLLQKTGEAGEVEQLKDFPGEGSTPGDRDSCGRGGSGGNEGKRSSEKENSFQIRGVTFDDTFGFSHSVENLGNANCSCAHQYMSVLVLEVHVQTRKDFRPDPDHDPIRALFYVVTFDSPVRERDAGVVVVGEPFLPGSAFSELSVHCVPTERALIEKFIALVRAWDPEILAGYEIEMNSWGYFVQRGFVLDFNLLFLLGRVRTEDFPKKNPAESSDTTSRDDVDDVPKDVRRMKISGRIVLDVWRVLRHEIALRSYTFENVMYHLSHERHPALSHERLSYYWEHPTLRFRHLVVEHFATRVLGLLEILDRLDFVNRTSELARLFGIQFYEVLSRGSQFRVESMMLRLAKPLNYVPVSPSVAQRAAMRAPASLPLILEPESLFYTDPVIVLDFQSLYPSIIIAYNYCFSTCLGRVEKLGNSEPFEFGCTQLKISPEELKTLEKDLFVSPAGVAFVKANVRKGVLPALLEKILETRLMIKKSMKENKENKILQKVLFSRQLGLKLIANVTYGYTAANFSGRMPCTEVGDSVVSKGRETLERAIQLVKKTRKWGARVVYGDTDSVFVLTPGRSREEAFKIGAEIAEAVTLDNPKPVKLKLEKVYQPCILQTKKRYVGYVFESPDQKEPTFEAKGVETVRRDGCPATGKILEKALRILFDTRDVSLVKKYTVRQFAKLYQGRVILQDLIFAKEYRGRNGYRPGACVPALQLAKEWTQYDKRAEPRVKERVPYVIVNGPPGVPLIRLVRSPTDLLSDPTLRINAVYYIMKAIVPPMQRCFSLLGVDVASWYSEMPRKFHAMYRWSCAEGQKKGTISQYFIALKCIFCSEVTSSPLCQKCEKDPQSAAVVLTERIRRWERSHEGLTELCRSCCGRPAQLDCVSLDCPVLFRKEQARFAARQGQTLREILSRYL